MTRFATPSPAANKSLVSQPKGPASPIQLLGLHVWEKRLEQWKRQITGNAPPPNVGRAEVAEKVSGEFEDGLQVDAKLVATDQAPYLDLVLFGPDGSEIASADPTFMPKDTATFRMSGTRYRVGFLPLQKGSAAVPAQNPWLSTTPYR